jgi:hypothetical protein
MKRLSSNITVRIQRRLLLDSRVVGLPMAYKPIFVLLSSLKPFLFKNLIGLWRLLLSYVG